MKIYLSPSNQPANRYAYGGTNEKVQMERVAKAVKKQLEPYDVDVIMATLSLGIERRDNEAKNHNANLYLAIHSNATGSSYNQATGTIAFYHPKAPITKVLASNLIEEVKKASPTKSNRFQVLLDGMEAFNQAGYHEIREPMKLGVPPVLLEVDFHDNPTVAKWIVESTDKIAETITKALIKTYRLKLKTVTKPIKPTEPTKPTKPSKGELKVEKIPTKPVIVLKKDTSMWAFDANKWADIKPVKKFKKSDEIEVADIVTNKLGGRYYRSVYSSKNGIMHGFNIVDCTLIYKE